MTTPLEEIKLRARLLQKAIQRGDAGAPEHARAMAKKRRWAAPEEWSLSLCMNIVSAEAGFEQWDHARRILTAEAQAGEDMGTLWYDDRCAALFNHWYAGYEDARASLNREGRFFLLPYARQFVVVEDSFIATLGMQAQDPLWDQSGRDMVAAYGSPAWQELAMQRLRNMRRPVFERRAG